MSTLRRMLRLRHESFGGTLLDVRAGRRTYLSAAETDAVGSGTPVGLALLASLSMEGQVIVSRPDFRPAHNFSAPDTVFMELTRACNLKCIHCFNSSGIREPDELSAAERHRVVEELAAAGVQEIRFTGGEPTLLPDAPDLIRLAARLGLRVSMGTNGIILHPSRIEAIAAALDLVVVSLDGTQANHDRIRGHGSFERAMEGLRLYARLGVETRVNTVLMRSNMSDVLDLARILNAAGQRVFIRRFIPSGRAETMPAEMLTREEYFAFETALRPCLDDPRALIRGHYLGEEKTEPRIPLPFPRHDCSAGHRGMVVLPDGRVQTCGFLGPLGEGVVGRLREEKFPVIWRRLVESNHLAGLRRKLSEFNAINPGPCTNCLAIGLSCGTPSSGRSHRPHSAEPAGCRP